MTLLPGLIDMHVHLDADPTCGGYTPLQFGDRFWSVLTVPHAQRTLQAGFTTVRNVGADAWNDVGLRQAIDAGKVTGPRGSPPRMRSASPAATAIRPSSRHRWTRGTRTTPTARNRRAAPCAPCASTARK